MTSGQEMEQVYSYNPGARMGQCKYQQWQATCYKIRSQCTLSHQQWTIMCSLSILTAIFLGEPGSANFIEAKDDGGGGDNRSYKLCKAPVKLSPPSNQHPTFYRPDDLPVPKPMVSTYWRNHIPWTSSPMLAWGLPTLSLTINSSWLHCHY